MAPGGPDSSAPCPQMSTVRPVCWPPYWVTTVTPSGRYLCGEAGIASTPLHRGGARTTMMLEAGAPQLVSTPTGQHCPLTVGLFPLLPRPPALCWGQHGDFTSRRSVRSVPLLTVACVRNELAGGQGCASVSHQGQSGGQGNGTEVCLACSPCFPLLKLALLSPVASGRELPRTSRTFRPASQAASCL